MTGVGALCWLSGRHPLRTGRYVFFTVAALLHRSMQCEFEINLLMSSIKEGPNDWRWAIMVNFRKAPHYYEEEGMFVPQ